MAVDAIGLADHSDFTEGLSSPGESGCGLIPPATCFAFEGVSTTD
jgi:hypothetical protein